MSVTSTTLTITQGSTLALTGQILQSGSPMNCTGYAIAGKIRRKFSDAASLKDLTMAFTDAATGAFSIGLTAAETAALTVSSTDPTPDSARTKSLGVWDAEISLAGVVTRILEGPAELSQEATK